MHYWCTGHAKSCYSTAFVNTGQWVKHKPHECRMKKHQQEQENEQNLAAREVSDNVTPSPSALVNAATIPPTPVAVLPLTIAGVTAGNTLPMRAKLKALIDNANAIKNGEFIFSYNG